MSELDNARAALKPFGLLPGFIGALERFEAAVRANERSGETRDAVLNEQGPSDHETIGEAAQMYRSLRPVIERTMAEPDRWDGDEDESFHLGRYVQWLAAERAQVRAEELTKVADLWSARSETVSLARERMDLRYRADELRHLANEAQQ